VLDHYAVDAWRTTILANWISRDLDVSALAGAIRANPVLPRDTTEGMLATLPVFASLTEEKEVSEASRQGIAAELVARYRETSDEMVLKTAATSLVAGVLVTAVATRTWAPAWGLFTLAALPIARIWLRRRALNLQGISTDLPPQPH
jgi:hypothetical protein